MDSVSWSPCVNSFPGFMVSLIGLSIDEYPEILHAATKIYRFLGDVALASSIRLVYEIILAVLVRRI